MNAIHYNLTDKVVVVTGGSRGIGFHIARMLLAENANVAICGRKQEGLDAAAALLGNTDRLITVCAHIGKEDEVESLFGKTLARFGRLDALVNNVGMNMITGVTDADPSLWRKIIDTNLTGTFLCARKAGQIMRGQNKGKIVSITSLAAHRASPAMGIYGIAKAGIEMMTKVLAQELAPHNITVNAVAPGMVRTDFSKPFWANPDLYPNIVKSIPLGRIAEPGDVAHAALFFCSEGSDFITGQTLLVDGGASAI
jgi:NAD(P)-dependent dehydrogenase (short-subunit alcohol dehydrogenase family)